MRASKFPGWRAGNGGVLMRSQTRTTSVVAKTVLILTALLPAIAAAASPPPPSHQDPKWLVQHGIPGKYPPAEPGALNL